MNDRMKDASENITDKSYYHQQNHIIPQVKLVLTKSSVKDCGSKNDNLLSRIKAAQQALLFQLEPDPSIRCDNFSVRGVALPYYKFPQNPRG